MSHVKRTLSEFITDDHTFRVTKDGDIETDETVLVFSEDTEKFIEWLTNEFKNLPKLGEGE